MVPLAGNLPRPSSRVRGGEANEHMSGTTGAQTLRLRAGEVEVLPHAHEGVASALKQGRPLLVVGRVSTEGGREASEDAVLTLEQAVRGLALKGGFDARHLLPPTSELVSALRTSKDVVKSTDADDGSPFTNRFLILDGVSQGLVVMVSVGSGLKLDENFASPPYTRLLHVSRQLEPAGIWSKRDDRLGRNQYSWQPLYAWLERQQRNGIPTWMGEDETSWVEQDAAQVLLKAIKSQQAHQQARAMPTQMKSAQRDKSGSRMENGRAEFACGGPAPAGLTRVLFLKKDGGKGSTHLVLDSPLYLPAQHEVHDLLPQVFTVDGEHVDQVANVRFALEALAAGKTGEFITQELLRRRFSTDTYRTRYGPSAMNKYSRQGAQGFMRMLINNVDLYEKGELVVDLGKEVGQVTITNIFPVDDPWLSSQDADAIRALGDRRRARYESMRKTIFDRLSCTLDGQPASLQQQEKSLKPNASEAPDTARYGIKVDVAGALSDYGGAWPQVSHEALAVSIYNALAAAQADPTSLQAVWGDEHDLVTEQRRLVDDLTTEQRNLLARQKLRLHELDEVRDGEWALSGALRREMQTLYGQADKRLQSLERDLNAARQRLDDALLVEQQDASTRSLTQLAEVAITLRRAQDITHRDTWRKCVREIHFKTVNHDVGGHAKREVTWSGVLVVQVEGCSRTVEFAGTFEHGAGQRLEVLAEGAITALRQGVSMRNGAMLQARVLRPLVAAKLNKAERECQVLWLDDPALIRLTMAVVHPDPQAASIADLAKVPEIAAFGNVSGLAQRIAVLEAHGLASWSPAGRNRAAAALAILGDGALAVAHEAAEPQFRPGLKQLAVHAPDVLVRTPDATDLVPCGNCAGRRYALSLLRHVQGVICLTCRADNGGVYWPADRYDRTLVNPSALLARGVSLHPTYSDRADGNLASQAAREHAKALGLLHDPAMTFKPPQVWQAALVDYLDETQTLEEVCERHGVSEEGLRRHVVAAGLPTRRQRRSA